MSDDQRDAYSPAPEANDSETSDPSHPQPDAAFYDADVVDPQTLRFARRVIALGIVVAFGLVLGAISLIWPHAFSDAVREMQGAY